MFAHGAKSIFDGSSYSCTCTSICKSSLAHTHSSSYPYICVSAGKTNSLFNTIFPTETPPHWAWMHNACSLYRMKSLLQCPTLCAVNPHLILHCSYGITHAHNISYYFSSCSSHSDIWFSKTASLYTIQWELAWSTDDILCVINLSSMQKHLQYFLVFKRQLYTSCIDLCMARGGEDL